jgi:ankyrin repeat protein
MLGQGLSSDAILPSGESLLTWAIRRGDKRLMDELVSANADINLADARGNTPMVAALHHQQRSFISTLRKQGVTIPKEWKYHQEQKPHQIVVTGPSAAKAPHPAGDRYFSSIDWRDLEVKPEPIKIEEVKKQVLRGRAKLRERSEASLKTQATDSDVIVPFPQASDRYEK